MAKISGLRPGFVPGSVTEIEKPNKRKPPSTSAYTCDCCGYSFEGSLSKLRKAFVIDNDEGKLCMGCYKFFLTGYTDMSPESAKERLEKIRQTGYAIILKSGNFSGTKSGISFSVEFGDIFQVSRIGLDNEPDGTLDGAFKMFTFDIIVGPEVLTLYPHEATAIGWTEIMMLRSEHVVEEAYLCSEDEHGYFAPSPDFKKDLIGLFGNR